MGAFFSTPLEIGLADGDLGIWEDVQNSVSCLIRLIKQNKGRVVIITGAGISSNQLPTFRSNNNSALWENFSASDLSKTGFYQDPDLCWRLLSNIRNLQKEHQIYPTLAHHVIHHLLNEGYVNTIITQNIDGLHSFEGDESKIIELHGKVSDHGICETCHATFPIDYMKILQTTKCPTCPKCGAFLRPDVAFFGDLIDKEKRIASKKAIDLAQLVILVGTHCTVDPVLSMVYEAKRLGALVANINIIEPPNAHNFVDISLIGKADDVFLEIGKALLSPNLQLDKLYNELSSLTHNI